MLLAENRAPFGAIYVPEQDFENSDSQAWFIATQLRYYLARITTAPFEVKANDDGNGIYISFDKDYADDEFSINTENGSLYITGVSMGATTVLMAIEQGLPTNVLGIIADCGFTSPAEIIKKVMKKDLKVPLFPFYYTTRAVTKLLTGFDFEEYSAVRAVRESKIPILFLHGKSDGFVPFYMGEEIYSAAACRKKAVWVEGADHGCSFLIDREGCTKALYGFLGI